jgi:hypothetical protein
VSIVLLLILQVVLSVRPGAIKSVERGRAA